MAITYETANGDLIDADGRKIGADGKADVEVKRFKVTYEGPDGRERYPDGSLVDRTPVSRDEVTAPYTPASVQADRAINPQFIPSAMSPGELMAAATPELQDNAGRELEPEDRDMLHAIIKEELAAKHVQDQIDSGTPATLPPPPPTWGAGDQMGNQIKSDDEQDLGAGGAGTGVSVIVPPAVAEGDDATLTPAQKAARTRAANKAAEEAREKEEAETTERLRLEEEAKANGAQS